MRCILEGAAAAANITEHFKPIWNPSYAGTGDTQPARENSPDQPPISYSPLLPTRCPITVVQQVVDAVACTMPCQIPHGDFPLPGRIPYLIIVYCCPKSCSLKKMPVKSCRSNLLRRSPDCFTHTREPNILRYSMSGLWP